MQILSGHGKWVQVLSGHGEWVQILSGHGEWVQVLSGHGDWVQVLSGHGLKEISKYQMQDSNMANYPTNHIVHSPTN